MDAPRFTVTCGDCGGADVKVIARMKRYDDVEYELYVEAECKRCGNSADIETEMG